MLLPLLAVAAASCPAPPPRAQPRPDRPRYRLDIRVAASLREVTGHVSVRFTPNRPTDRLVFRLWPNGPRERGEGMRLDVGRPTSPGRRVRADRPDPTTLVVRTGNLAPGQAVRVRIPWRLHVPAAPIDRISRFRGGVRLGSFFPILAWDPRRGWVTDPPARILGESSTSPAADFDVRVRAPRGFTALVSGVSSGRRRWRARAVRDVAVEVARLRIIDHETTHQWFYSLVGNDQARDPWLDETLATWGQQRLDGLIRPDPGSSVPAGVRRHVAAPMTYWTRFPRGYFWGVYEEGANALRSLRDDAAVDCALRAYAARQAYAIARPGDLLDELNRLIPGAEARLRAWGIHR